MEKNLLILATTHDFLGKFEQDNVRILHSMGYTVHYAANLNEPDYLDSRSRLRELGVIPHHIDAARSPFRLRENRQAFHQLMQLTRQIPFRIVHCHTPVGGVLGRLIGLFGGKRAPVILYTAHGFHFYKGAPPVNRTLYYLAERTLAHFTDILILINREDEENARRFHLKKGGRICRIPGTGLDRERFRPPDPAAREEWREELGIGEHELFLLSVGELNRNKNHQTVLKALAEMKRRCAGPSAIRYGICGEGVLHDVLSRQISALGLRDTVTLYGYREDIPRMLSCADASVFPSKREGLGMAGLESLAVGTPVIAADNRGTREYMVRGGNGFIFDPPDAEGLIGAIESFRSLSDTERKAMSERCRISTEPFDQKYADQIMREVYEDADRRAEQRR